jgi:hypothetical protein
MSITDQSVFQKALRKLRRHGPADTLHFAWLKLVNLVLPFKILRGMYASRVVPALLACPYQPAFLLAQTLRGLARNPATELSPQFLDDALGAGDECYAISDGGCLAAYGWYSTRPTPAASPELLLHFAPGYVYMYKGFTLPRYRGQQLHAIGKTRALQHYLSKGYGGMLSYVESTNFDSLRSASKMGAERFGSIYLLRLFGRYFAFSSPGCRRFDFRIEVAAASARGLQRGKI